MSEQFVKQADPEDVFMSLADERRLGILQALWEADGGPMSFSKLREATGVRDSGQFNYHLDKLVDQFVTRTDDGYELTQAGEYVNGAIASGMYTMQSTVEPIVLDNPCRMCGGTLTLRYADETARIECDSCPSGWHGGVPPAVLAGVDREDIPAVVSDFLWAKCRYIVDGFCTSCNGRLEPTVGLVSELDIGPSEEADEDPPAIQFDCQQCGTTSGLSLEHGILLAEPMVERFYQEHGIDIRSRHIWGLSELDPAGVAVERERRDPARASVTFQAEDDTLTVVVDEGFDVVETGT